MDFILEIKNIILFLSDSNMLVDVKEKEEFLISLIPFMRSYSNLFVDKNDLYKDLCKLMHGYENQKNRH